MIGASKDGIDSLSSTLVRASETFRFGSSVLKPYGEVLNNIQMQLGVHISVTEWMAACF